MSLACGIPFLECVCCLACTRWAWKRLLYSAGHESEHWGLASPEEFEPVPRLCRLILGVYEDDLENPQWPPDGGYRIDTECVVVRKNYAHTQGNAPPYLVYLDHDNKDIILAIRGLNLEKRGDYTVLLDNRLGMKKFDGGYVHNGLLKAAVWVLDAECETLKELIVKYQDYTLTFAGHSLGAGIASLLSIMVMQNRDRLANVERSRIRCFAMAPARCMSLNLALRFADVINSVVLQDDFLPRTATPLEDIFKSLFCLPCLLCMRCVADTFTLEEKMLKDPRRLYAPGRLYHIVNRQLCKCGRFPPVVRTAVPVDGRFDHIVLSCNAISDHGIVWIEKEAQNALDLMLEKDAITSIPPHQKMQRQKTLAKEHSKEHKAALWLAVSLEIPEAYAPSEYGTFDAVGSPEGSTGESSLTREGFQTESWDELTNHLSETDETTGHTDTVLKEAQPHN